MGETEVDTLVGNQRAGNISVLVDCDQANLDLYLPDGTYTSETNAFLVRTRGKVVLVDTAFGGVIFESLMTLGVEPSQVDAILLTHLHGDHIGGLQKDGVALFPNAKVYLAQQEKDSGFDPGVPSAAATALAPYGARVETFIPVQLSDLNDDSIMSVSVIPDFPGIKPIAAFGHTPGHTMYLIESSSSSNNNSGNNIGQPQRLLIWGDLVHVELIQLPVPGQSVTYDTDPVEAAAVRAQVFAFATTQNNNNVKLTIAGMHLLYPTMGTVTVLAEGEEGYMLTKASEQTDSGAGSKGKDNKKFIIVVMIVMAVVLL